VHAGGSADNGGEKRNVLIVSVLLPKAVDLALRCKPQRRVEVVGVGEVPVFVERGYLSPLVRDGQVEDQAPAARLFGKVVSDLHVTAPLACACRDSMLGARADFAPRADP
jgi:hypothetical protein